MARSDLTYITLNDFTPGIYSKWGASGQLGKDGAAQVSDGRDRYTFGCYGDPDGGLRPLPRRVKTFTTDFTENTYTNLGPRTVNPISGTKVGVIDFVAQGGMYQSTLTAATDDEHSRGLLNSYPEASLLHPDSLFVLTSHRTDAYSNIFLWTSQAYHLDGSAWTANGALVGQFRVWEVARLTAGSGALNNVEMTLQVKVAAAEWGDTSWSSYATATGNTDYNVPTPFAGRTVTSTDSWHAGTIAVGRSTEYVSAATSADPAVITLDTLDRPGSIVVLASLVNGYAACENGNTTRVVGWPNIFTVFGANTRQNPGYILTAGVNQAINNISTPNTTYQYNGWTYFEVPRMLVEHQDRFVGNVRTWGLGDTTVIDGGFDFDQSTATYNANQYVEPSDKFRFTEFNAALVYDITDGTPSADNVNIWKRVDANKPRAEVWGNWSPSGVGVLASWGNDLLIVKHEGGGGIVRGALEDAQVIRAPGIHSTGNVSCVPAYTPAGVVYGTSEGVVMWAGELTSEYISPQLDGWFWNTGAANEVSRDNSGKRKDGISGRFCYQYPFVYCPNDYVFDIRTSSWSRLIDPETDTNPYKHMFFDTNNQGKVYAARGAYDANNLGVVDLFDPLDRAPRYQWVSQPIIQSINRDLDVGEVVVVGQGTGRVRVTIMGIGNEEESRTFTFSDPDRPTRVSQTMSIRVSEMVMVVEAVGDDTPGGTTQTDAPVVHAIHIGVNEGPGIPRDGGS